MEAELANAGDLIHYVQLADAPGRGGPERARSTGPSASVLRDSGYDGPVGLEYYPTTASEASVATSSRFARAA